MANSKVITTALFGIYCGACCAAAFFALWLLGFLLVWLMFHPGVCGVALFAFGASFGASWGWRHYGKN